MMVVTWVPSVKSLNDSPPNSGHSLKFSGDYIGFWRENIEEKAKEYDLHSSSEIASCLWEAGLSGPAVRHRQPVWEDGEDHALP